MEKLKKYKKSFWRIPLISVIAGLLYTPCYVRIVLRFGVIEPGVIDSKVSLLTSGGLLIVFLLLGWIALLRNETRMEIFVSASIVVVYGLLLWVIQVLSGSTTGPAAVVFMRLAMPLEWMGFPSSLGFYLREHMSITIPFIGFLNYFIPWLFVLFGKKASV
ncbi:hypothetical protein AALC17_10905 [Oscillospiraceae bacterium 38-13]